MCAYVVLCIGCHLQSLGLAIPPRMRRPARRGFSLTTCFRQPASCGFQAKRSHQLRAMRRGEHPASPVAGNPLASSSRRWLSGRARCGPPRHGGVSVFLTFLFLSELGGHNRFAVAASGRVGGTRAEWFNIKSLFRSFLLIPRGALLICVCPASKGNCPGYSFTSSI